MSIFPARLAAVFAVSFALLASAAPVRADTGPVFVVPSRPGVPIAINGRDASWSVVEGDWGLARPGHGSVTIIGGGRPLPPRWSYDRNPYYPRYGTMPQRGRYEIEPPADRPMPEPAETYTRSWSTSSEPYTYNEQRTRAPLRQRPQPDQSESDNLPATIDDGQQQYQPPPIVVVPHRDRNRRP